MALQRFPVTSFEAMRFLDVYHVPARVLQLRQAGHDIVTHWRTVETEAGATHRVGLYVLHRGTSPATA
jgi:Helix-turn-helix domain